LLDNISPERPVLIAGTTASGKSALALEIAARQGGVIINADALQVFANWHVLTARPSPQEIALTPHALYGHIPGSQGYSVGHWLRDVAPFLNGAQRPIIVGGTGLYFSALTEGLADIPDIPKAIRQQADARMQAEGHRALLDDLDPTTVGRIDTNNPVRVQRAWEVLRATGRGLAAWQDDTPAPLLALENAETILIDAARDWLAERADRRFDLMLKNGALDEARANLADWDPMRPSSKAIGAPELIAYLTGQMSLEQAGDSAKTATRRYAKRQRTWFRARMKTWNRLARP